MRAKELSNEQKYLNLRQAKDYIGVAYNTLYKMIDEGLPVITLGKTKRISVDDLEAYMEAHKK